VEAGLHPGACARRDVVGHLLRGRIRGAGRRFVDIYILDARGVRADRAVQEQVAARPDRAEPARLLGRAELAQ
jgi:hypothetical protein